MFPLAQAAPVPIPPIPDSGDGVGLWALYVLVVLLVAAVAELWRRRIVDERDARARYARREEAEQKAETARNEVARLDAASRTTLADALREFTEQIRGCPAKPNDRAHHERALRAMEGPP